MPPPPAERSLPKPPAVRELQNVNPDMNASRQSFRLAMGNACKLLYIDLDIVYSGLRSCLIYGCETWPVKVEHEVQLDRTEMSMIRWM